MKKIVNYLLAYIGILEIILCLATGVLMAVEDLWGLKIPQATSIATVMVIVAAFLHPAGAIFFFNLTWQELARAHKFERFDKSIESSVMFGLLLAPMTIPLVVFLGKK